jgi:predicted O-methyltransferase YrrM
MSVYQVNKYIKHRFFSNKRGFGIHSPFVFDFINNVLENNDVFYGFEKIERIRKKLSLNDNQIDINDLGAGSQKFSSSQRKISDIAKYSIKPKKQAEFIFRLANFINAENILELGTSLGITTLYLSLTSRISKIYTIEGDKNIFNLADNNFKKFNCTNIHNYLGNFDDKLPEILNTIDKFDLVFIDGNHTMDATINYFNKLKEHTHSNSVIIFDDIYWSKEMTKAWNSIIKDEKISVSIDLFYLGLVFFKDNIPKQNFKLFSNNL